MDIEHYRLSIKLGLWRIFFCREIGCECEIDFIDFGRACCLGQQFTLAS